MERDAENKEELRQAILEQALFIFHRLQAAEGWSTPPKEIEAAMDEIFRLATVSLDIKE